MIAVFARASHPNYNNGEWRYHGYSVIFVRASSESQIKSVQRKLQTDGLPEPYEGHASYEQGWYGGKSFDLISVLPGNRLLDMKKLWLPVGGKQTRTSIGDNRYAGFYDAEELLWRASKRCSHPPLTPAYPTLTQRPRGRMSVQL